MLIEMYQNLKLNYQDIRYIEYYNCDVLRVRNHYCNIQYKYIIINQS